MILGRQGPRGTLRGGTRGRMKLKATRQMSMATIIAWLALLRGPDHEILPIVHMTDCLDDDDGVIIT